MKFPPFASQVDRPRSDSLGSLSSTGASSRHTLAAALLARRLRPSARDGYPSPDTAYTGLVPGARLNPTGRRGAPFSERVPNTLDIASSSERLSLSETHMTTACVCPAVEGLSVCRLPGTSRTLGAATSPRTSPDAGPEERKGE